MIKKSLDKAFSWIRLNQLVKGFSVLKLCENVQIGHEGTSSKKQAVEMFPTWFSLLSLVELEKFYGKNNFTLVSFPGVTYMP